MAEAALRASECLLCSEEVKKPVTLSCGHRFCFICLLEHYCGEIYDKECPNCERRISLDWDMNFSLKRGERSEGQTEEHKGASVSSETQASLKEKLQSELQRLLINRKRIKKRRKRTEREEQRNEERIQDLTQALRQLDPTAYSREPRWYRDFLLEDPTRYRWTVPMNLKRFRSYTSVLGSEGFSSGSHYWDVEVGDHSEWTIGLVKESVNRTETVETSPQNGFWCLRRHNDEYYNIKGEKIKLSKHPEKITVWLGYDTGVVFFLDSESRSMICSHKDTFTEKLFPYICVGPAGGDTVTKEITVNSTSSYHESPFDSEALEPQIPRPMSSEKSSSVSAPESSTMRTSGSGPKSDQSSGSPQ